MTTNNIGIPVITQYARNMHTEIKEYVSKYFDIHPGHVDPRYIHCMYNGISLVCWRHKDNAGAHRELLQIVHMFNALQLAGVIFKEKTNA